MTVRNFTQSLLHRLEDHKAVEFDALTAQVPKLQLEGLWRVGIVFVVVLVGTFLLKFIFPLFWFAAYAIASYGSAFFTAQLARTRTISSFLSVLASFALQAIIFRSLIIYLWYFEHPSAQPVAFLMFASASRYSASAAAQSSSKLAIATLADIGVLLFLAFEFYALSKTSSGATFVFFAILGLTAYYLVTLLRSLEHLHSLRLVENRTRQAQKMEAVGRLTGGVAHDFNNILTVVIGNIDLIDEIDDPDERQLLWGKTREAAMRASELTAQLLAFSRRSPLLLETHDVPKLVERLSDLTGRVLPATITMQADIPDDIWPVRTDGTQLEVALLNLVINARDAMPEGGRILLYAENVKLGQLDRNLAAGRYIAFHLLDEGGGIPEEMIDKVTEPFFTTKPLGEGSGLGLSMVKGFTEQSGGNIAIDVDPGRSTRITLHLPAGE